MLTKQESSLDLHESIGTAGLPRIDLWAE